MRCVVCGAKHRTQVPRCSSCELPFRQAGEPLPVIARRYEVRKFLGRGGMGSVFAAWDRTLEEAVAVKILRRDIEDLESMTRRFRSEIRLARRIRHPNVCGIHEYGEDDSTSYIAMELVEGENLKRVLQRDGALTGRQVFDVALQLAAGLQAIHEAGVVHRDLKSSNVMLDRHGRLRLMDFGIAKQYGSEVAGITVAGQIVGTPEYMSPEQAQGEPLDFRSDIYAAGIILFEIFTGRVPFHAETPIATLYKQVQEPPPLDQPLARWLPDDIKDMLRRALAKHRTDRYQSASELGEALARLAKRFGGLSPKGPATMELHTTPRLPDPPSAPPASPAEPDRPSGPAAATGGTAGGAAAREPVPDPPGPTQAIPTTRPGSRPPVAQPPSTPKPPTPSRFGVALAAGGGLLAILGIVLGGGLLPPESRRLQVPSADACA